MSARIERPSILFHCIDPAKNRRRFYRLSVERDLFGAVIMVREWGRIGRPGRIALASFSAYAEAVDAMRRQASRKERRGYHRV